MELKNNLPQKVTLDQKQTWNLKQPEKSGIFGIKKLAAGNFSRKRLNF